MSLLNSASLCVTPNGYKAGTLYSVIPNTTLGDMTVVRATTATRVNSAGLIESVANNVPRLDYSNGTCPSILVEPQRTNLMTYSEQLDNAAWTATAITVTANATTSPDGTTNADKLIPTNVSAFHNLYNYAAVLTGNYSFSVFVKKGGYNFVSLQDQFSGVFNSCFDLVNGTVTTFVGSSNIKSYGNDWFLCSVTGNGVGTTVIPSIVPANAISSFPIFTGNGTDGIFAWGAQFEAGAYPTSYIPTTSAAVTRNADVISKTGISALIGQTEGVLFTDFVCDGFDDYGTPLSINDGTASNYIWLTTFASGNIRAEVYNGSVQASITYTGGVVGQRYKVAFAYKQNDFVMYVNGTQIGTDTSGNIPPSLSRIDYNLVNNWSLALLKVNLSALLPTRLTNAELASLTTI